jgi:hypothetical protein
LKSQDGLYEGRVVGFDNVPIVEVLVKCDNGFTLTDQQGYFSFKTDTGVVKIQFSKTGFVSLDTLLVNGKEHRIVLLQDKVELEEVSIEERKRKDYFLIKALQKGLENPDKLYAYESFQTEQRLDSLKTAKAQKGYFEYEGSFKEKIFYQKEYPSKPQVFPLGIGARWLSENFITQGPLHPSAIDYGSRLIDYATIFEDDYLFDGIMTVAIPSISNQNSYSWSGGSWGALNQKLAKRYEFRLKGAEDVYGQLWVAESDTSIVQLKINIGQSYLNSHDQLEFFISIENETYQIVSILAQGQKEFKRKFELKETNQKVQWRKGVQIEYELKNNDTIGVSIIDSTEVVELQKHAEYNLEHAYDSMDNHYNELEIWDYIINGISFYNHRKRYHFRISPILEQTNIIGIGGYRHTLEGSFQKYDSIGNYWKISSWGDYGFGNQDVTGRIRFQKMFNIKQFAFWGVSGGSMYQLLSFGVPLQDILSRSNYVRNDFGAVEFHTQVYRGFFWWANSKFSDRQSIDYLNLAGWSDKLFGEDNEPLKFEPYQEWKIESGIDYTPFQKIEVLPFQERLVPSKYPTFSIDFEYGVPKLLGSDVHYLNWEIGVKKRYLWMGSGNYSLIRRDFLFANNLEFPNFFFIPGNTPFLFISPDYALQLLENTIRTDQELYEVRWMHHFDRKILSYVPLFKQLKAEFVLGGGGVWQPDQNYYHAETYYGVEIPLRISKAKYKLGFFHAIRPQLSDAFRQQFKFGINFFNPFTARWEY